MPHWWGPESARPKKHECLNRECRRSHRKKKGVR